MAVDFFVVMDIFVAMDLFVVLDFFVAMDLFVVLDFFVVSDFFVVLDFFLVGKSYISFRTSSIFSLCLALAIHATNFNYDRFFMSTASMRL